MKVEKIIGAIIILASFVLLVMSTFSFLAITIIFLNGLAIFLLTDYPRPSEYLRLIAIALTLILFLRTILIS
jgi:hypothetical protein